MVEAGSIVEAGSTVGVMQAAVVLAVPTLQEVIIITIILAVPIMGIMVTVEGPDMVMLMVALEGLDMAMVV